MTGHPALPVGTTLDGERSEAAAPFRATVSWARVDLEADWPAPASALRGAVVAALGGPDAHVDFHGHLGDGTNRQAPACVLYRVHYRRPSVWLYGPRAHDHARLVGVVDHLRDPAAGGVPVTGASMSMGTTDVGVDKDGWHRYSVEGYFPSEVAYARRPRGRPSPEQDAWATGCLVSSCTRWLGQFGIEPQPQRPLVVHVVHVRHHRVEWRGRKEAVRWGFSARFVSNAILPDGVGLGQHVSEGWGEVRRA